MGSDIHLYKMASTRQIALPNKLPHLDHIALPNKLPHKSKYPLSLFLSFYFSSFALFLCLELYWRYL